MPTKDKETQEFTQGKMMLRLDGSMLPRLFVDGKFIGSLRSGTDTSNDEDDANVEHIALCWNSHDELVEALQWFMDRLDDKTLVRDILKDSDPSFAMRMLGFVTNLKSIQELLDKLTAQTQEDKK